MLGCFTLVVGACSMGLLAQTGGTGEYAVYPCRHKPVQTVEKLLRDLLPTDASVHLVADAKSNSLLLRGPREVQTLAK